MSAARTFETRLPEVLEELSNPRTPAYYDDILGQVARTRQRPGWTFIERWLPLTTISGRLATAPRVPMRLAVVLLLLLLAFAMTVLLAGTSRQPVPAPFGVAGNGQIVFTDSTGQINVGTLADGTSRIIVPGSGHSRPVFSPDGRWLAYLQNGNGGTDIVVSGPNGEAPRVLSATAIGSPIGHFGWAPDSKAVIAFVGADILAFDLHVTGSSRTIFKGADGTRFNSFNDNLTDFFRPPNGDEILFVGNGPKGSGVYRQALAGGAPIAVVTDQMVPSVWDSNQSGAQWSPDGKRIAMAIHPPNTPDFGRAYIVNADGTGLRRVGRDDSPGYIIDDEHISWSPDGTRIALGRWLMYADGGVDPRPVTIVDVATNAETEAANREVNGYHGWSWSPDGSSIIEVPGDGSEDPGIVIVVDAATGEARKMSGWTSVNGPADWQRTVPAS
jgi:Tol biopolymer transport system component